MNKNDDIFPSMEDARIERLRKFLHSHYEENKELIDSIVPTSGTLPIFSIYNPYNVCIGGEEWNSYDS